ncbi:MAG: hypothetical protein HY581_08015 [Nitrospirae bacterium]|nr:hypothetical protein [Nitrospirota bacterium]
MRARASLLTPVFDELAFSATRRVVASLSQDERDFTPTEIDGAICYHPRGRSPTCGLRLVIRPSGHRIWYGEDGRRILCTDSFGTVLHECEWAQGVNGAARLARARVRLDSLLWIGLIPEAAIHTTTLAPPCLGRSHQAGQRSLVTEDLRRKAAQAWRVPFDDVRYFYPDSSFEWDANGRVAIRLKKDGLFLLEDGTFAQPRFISYMGAIPWARIDLLNVVELFQSTLPGTGSAVFELIWGLCDDQRQVDGPMPLRYRGLPTYPSEPAYGLFSAFFRPEAPNGADPHELFMDPAQTNQIAWWLRHDPPWRSFDRSRNLCVTVQNGMVQKVTVADDPVGVPYIAPGSHGGFASCERTVVVVGSQLCLRDGDLTSQLPIDPAWGITRETHPHQVATYPFGWRAFFNGHLPPLDPVRVHALALFYPDDETEVAELSTQPFVLEQLYASLSGLGDRQTRLARITRVLIDGLDAMAAGCIDHDYIRSHTVLYRCPEWAQKNAQALWDQAAQAGRLNAVRDTRFLPNEMNHEDAYQREYDLIYCWIPFRAYDGSGWCERVVMELGTALSGHGLAFMVGPGRLRSILASHALRVLSAHAAQDLARLPLLREHIRLHPNTRLKSSLTVFLVEKLTPGEW